MEFCNKCDNIYYIEIHQLTGKLNYKCKKCKNFVDLNKVNKKSYLIKTNIQKKKASYDYIINEYTKYDNTLPRIKHISCPKCSKSSQSPQEHKLPQEHKSAPAAPPPPSPQQQQTQVQLHEQKSQQAPPSAPPSPPVAPQAQNNDKHIDDDDEDSDLFGQINQLGDGIIMEGGATSDENEVIFIRYDDINLKYIYLCCKCDYVWKL